MKKTKLLSALVFVLAAALLLGACSVKLGGEETWEYTAEDKKGSEGLTLPVDKKVDPVDAVCQPCQPAVDTPVDSANPHKYWVK